MRRLAILFWLATSGCVASAMYGGTVGAQNAVSDTHFVEPLRGVNWRGLETAQHLPQGLNQRPWREVLDQMQSLGINAIRSAPVLGHPTWRHAYQSGSSA